MARKQKSKHSLSIGDYDTAREFIEEKEREFGSFNRPETEGISFNWCMAVNRKKIGKFQAKHPAPKNEHALGDSLPSLEDLEEFLSKR